LGYLLDDLAGAALVRMLGDVGLRDDADQTAVLFDDRDPPHLVLRHEPKHLVEILLRVDRDEVGGGNFPYPRRLGISALGDDADCDVAVGQRATRRLPSTIGASPTSSSRIIFAA
jgi:hypothetical protein